ncbi:hypothetical protein H2204_006346 [Knufia peltigerae]|uniref:GDP-mannose transporter n=1 Tax=Knufia peltigerae TaxID=1002370 RepID=A0AA38Y3S7_9EURO|nr:hypothetical protein H2204_006346 [Knufia peltigerae]
MLYRRILPGGDEGSGVTKQAYSTTILPAALLLGLSIIFGNKAFLYLNVPSIQMIKTSSPAVVLFVSWLFKLSRPGIRVLVRFALLVIGGTITSAGDAHFNIVGATYQVSAIFTHAVRLNLIQLFVKSSESQMHPLRFLHYLTPPGALLTGLAAYVFEPSAFSVHNLVKVRVYHLILNAALAFTVNISMFFLVCVQILVLKTVG